MEKFIKAERKQAKLRLALDGPSGSGKTYTALIAATEIACGGKVAVIDTERNSASLYSDKFSFDVATLDKFSPKAYVELIAQAESDGYSVIVIDSLSHAWEGIGGVLDMHDEATRRQKTHNSYTAWADVTPEHRALIDAMLQSKCHIIATMRSKMEYVQEKDANGKTVIRKVGMAPVQRQGMEYEFTIVGDLDADHTLVISKSRCEKVSDAVVTKPGSNFFKVISEWLNSGMQAPEPTKPAGNGNGKATAEPTKPAPESSKKAETVKAASLKYQPFVTWANTWVQNSGKNYARKDNPLLADMWHLLKRIGVLGFREVAAENVDDIKAALESHVRGKSDNEHTDETTV